MPPWNRYIEEGGFTLVELAIVVAILGILVTITAVAVTGSSNTARGTTKAADVYEVQKAVNGYQGLHEYWPTLGKTAGSLTIPAGGLPEAPFSAADPTTFVSIDWDATFTTTLDGTRSLVPSFLAQKPKHALDVTADADGAPEQSSPTRVWVLDASGIVHVLLSDAAY
ncbi:MAG: type II secretion system protein [Dehalococcoidia bacterium]|nr:type II secretion system protein [Dehalococcoidia bacterium]